MSGSRDRSTDWVEVVPGRVVHVRGQRAVVDHWGVRSRVRLDLVHEAIGVGDFVVSQAGFATRRIPSEDVSLAFELYDDLLISGRSYDSTESSEAEEPEDPAPTPWSRGF
jgi:hydrogenase maturation factor